MSVKLQQQTMEFTVLRQRMDIVLFLICIVQHGLVVRQIYDKTRQRSCIEKMLTDYRKD